MIGNKKHHLVAGATGLIGTQLLQLLLDDPEVGKITVLSRRELDVEHKKLHVQLIEFDEMDEKHIPVNVDAVFCCLGTTMALAGSKDAFRKVDFEYVVKLAVFAQRRNIPQFHVISARGANAKSMIFYNKVKGRMELELRKLTKLKSIYIYRPSLLLGNRSEFRFGESMGKKAMTWFKFLIPKSSRAVYDIQVAMAMHQHAAQPEKGVHVVDNASMVKLA